MIDKISNFLSGKTFAVVGASTNREKYGNKVLRCYQQNKLNVYPVNPRAEIIEGLKCYPDLKSIPEKVDGISVIIPPKFSIELVKEAESLGIKNIWFQPGAESQVALNHANKAGITAIGDGSCILVALGYHE